MAIGVTTTSTGATLTGDDAQLVVDAAVGVTSVAGKISAINDQSSGGTLDLTQATAGNQPRHVFGPRPAIRFEYGSNEQYLIIPSGFTIDRRAFSFFAVLSTQHVPAYSPDLEESAQLLSLGLNGSSLPSDIVNVYRGGGADAGKIQIWGGVNRVSSLRARSSRYFLGVIGGASGLTVMVDDDVESMTVLNTGSGTGGWIGGWYAGSTKGSERADLYEARFYSRAVTTAEADAMRQYMVARHALVTNPSRVVVLLGDSIAAGNPVDSHNAANQSEVIATAPNLRFVNASRPGYTIAQVTTLASTLLPAYFVPGARNVSVHQAGANDVSAGTTGAAAWALMATQIAAAVTAGYTPVIQTLVSASDQTDTDAYNVLARAYATTNGYQVIDAGASTQVGASGANANTVYFNGDGVHPNRRGQAVIARLWDDVLPFVIGLNDRAAASVNTKVVGTVQPQTGDAYAKSVEIESDIAGVPAAVEAAIINDADGQAVQEAIVNKINEMTDLDALSLAAIASAVRTDMDANSTKLATAATEATSANTKLTDGSAKVDLNTIKGQTVTAASAITIPGSIGTSTLTDQNVRDAMKLAPTAGAPVSGSLDAHLDTIEAKTSTIGSARFRVTSPVTQDGTIEIWKGDDHLSGNRVPTWSVEDYAGPDLDGATAVFRIQSFADYTKQIGKAIFEADASISVVGDTATITAPMTAAQTVLLTASESTLTHYYQVIATTDTDEEVTLAEGRATVRQRIATA